MTSAGVERLAHATPHQHPAEAETAPAPAAHSPEDAIEKAAASGLQQHSAEVEPQVKSEAVAAAAAAVPEDATLAGQQQLYEQHMAKSAEIAAAAAVEPSPPVAVASRRKAPPPSAPLPAAVEELEESEEDIDLDEPLPTHLLPAASRRGDCPERSS